MLFDKIFEEVENLGKPQDGDLILLQIDGRWAAVQHPHLPQKFYADAYEEIETLALEYAADKSERGIAISVWKKHDFNTGKHIRVL